MRIRALICSTITYPIQ
jgi:hypothetical protein